VIVAAEMTEVAGVAKIEIATRSETGDTDPGRGKENATGTETMTDMKGEIGVVVVMTHGIEIGVVMAAEVAGEMRVGREITGILEEVTGSAIKTVNDLENIAATEEQPEAEAPDAMYRLGRIREGHLYPVMGSMTVYVGQRAELQRRQ
jgi:hypothetical protein